MMVPRALLIVAVVAAALGFVGQFGSVSLWADSMNYLTPVWLGGGLTAGLIATLTFQGRLRQTALASFAIVLVTGGLNLAHGAGQTPGAGAAALTIVQFNVSKHNRDPVGSANWILNQDADIVVLEEAALQGGEVKRLLGQAYPFATDCLGGAGRCSTVVLSRTAPIRSEGLARGDPENRQTLSAVRAGFADEAGPFTVVGVHMRRPWPYDDQTRDIGRLSNLLEGEDQSRLIIAGDFNQPPWTFAMRRQDLALRIRRLTGGLGTWPVGGIDLGIAGLAAPVPTILPIDHIYAGRAWRLVSIRRGPDLGSEHRPLVVGLARRSNY